jgi:2-C-methyl-D-erythritol 4-phosphate cytidylyltransferase
LSRNAVIIVAGGTGSRMNSALPKQFLVLCGLPVIMRSIRQFFLFDPAILVVIALPESYKAYWQELCDTYNFGIEHTIATGGKTRFHSVKNALELIPDNTVVAIHDAVRPLVSQNTIRVAFREALSHGNAIPVVPVAESMRKITGEKSEPVPRDLFRMVQTPQVFQAEAIKKAYASARHEDFTDDATVLEESGETLFLIDGNPENIKITTPPDLLFAEAVLMNSSSKG